MIGTGVFNCFGFECTKERNPLRGFSRGHFWEERRTFAGRVSDPGIGLGPSGGLRKEKTELGESQAGRG